MATKKIDVNKISKDLGTVAATVEEQQISGKLQYIPAKNIKLNPNNKAAKNDTPESIYALSVGIQTVGLLHPLVVNHIGNNEYTLISGERRYKAITEHLKWDMLPCNVFENYDMGRAALNLANTEVRQYSAAEMLELIEDLDEALKSQKEAGTFKGSINKAISEMLKLSERQIKRYKSAAQNTGTEERESIKNVAKASTREYKQNKEKKPEAAGEMKIITLPEPGEKLFLQTNELALQQAEFERIVSYTSELPEGRYKEILALSAKINKLYDQVIAKLGGEV